MTAYYAWLTSEYLVDDFTEVVRSDLFARNVSARLAEQALQVPPGVIRGSAATGKQHRIITLSFTWGDAGELAAIAQAAADELTENAPFYFKQLGTDGAGISSGAPSAAVGRSATGWSWRCCALFAGLSRLTATTSARPSAARLGRDGLSSLEKFQTPLGLGHAPEPL